MTTVIQKPYTGEGFKGERLFAVLSVSLVLLSIISSLVSIRAMSLQHKQIANQMEKEEDLIKKK
jgi:hypothetical protein